jgi:magnesium chelatase family protein
MARWALEIAAAGGHHLMMVGPPGCGKSMLASCLPGILPPMAQREWFEVASVASVCQEASLDRVRPFRSPGQGTSAVAMLGGQQPGEVTRAHHGVLFLDEFPEFRRDTLEALRQVMETGTVSVVRARMRVVYPASFTLVAAMNPCPCGLHAENGEACSCTDAQRMRYAGKLSGPLRDRFDLLVALERQSLSSYMDPAAKGGDCTAVVRERVMLARAAQLKRGVLNRDLRGAQLRQSLALSCADEAFCQVTGDRLSLSVRAMEKWLRVARTIADLNKVAAVTRTHLLNSLGLRGPSERALAS